MVTGAPAIPNSPKAPWPPCPDPEDSHAVDEQLTAILEAIRSWDWRAGIFADDGTLKREAEPTGRHMSKLNPVPEPLSSFSSLFVEPSIDAIGSHQPTSAETYPPSDPRPLIEDPLGPPRPRPGISDGQPDVDLTATTNVASPQAAPPAPAWAPRGHRLSITRPLNADRFGDGCLCPTGSSAGHRHHRHRH